MIELRSGTNWISQSGQLSQVAGDRRDLAITLATKRLRSSPAREPDTSESIEREPRGALLPVRRYTQTTGIRDLEPCELEAEASAVGHLQQ